jgi:cellulase (glycosyl hydrolase family 5)/uncharacterized protein DUF5060
MRIARFVQVLVGCILVSSRLGLGVEITSLQQNAEQVGRFEKFEATFALSESYSNPFDPNIIDIQVTFTQPDDSTATIPAFFYREYEVIGDSPETYANPGPPLWKVRFAPSLTGMYSYDILVDEGGSVSSFPNLGTFTCTEAQRKGFIRLDPRDATCLAYDDGTPRLNVGHNVCWLPKELGDCQTYFTKMASAGENWTRIWMCPWTNDGWVMIEYSTDHWSGNFSGVGTYSLQTSQRLDSVIELAEQLGIGIQLVLQYHGLFSTTTNANWDDNPYNAARPQDGGFLQNPEDFFTHAEAIRLTKNKYRYIIARWGYSPAILAWELWNEVQYTDGWNQNPDQVVAWHAELAQYVRNIDPFEHLITTSSHQQGFENIWSLPNIDLIQVHRYGTPVIGYFEDIATELRSTYDKPVLIGEYGAGSVNGMNSESQPHDLPEPFRSQMLDALVLHNGIWSAFHSKSSAHLWWWDNYIDPFDFYSEFAPLSDYMHGEDLAGLEKAPRAVSGADSYFANPLLTNFTAESTQTEFTLQDNRFPGMENLSQWLHGSSKPSLRSDPTFHLTMLETGELVIHVQNVSSWGIISLRVLVDSVQVFSDSYANGTSNFTISVPLGAGEQSIQIENTGQDWFQIPSYEFRPNQISPLDSVGLIGMDRALYWIYDIGSQYGETPHGTITNEPVIIQGLVDGPYEVQIFDTRGPGGIIEQGYADSVNGLLTYPLPDFSADIAVKVKPACIVDMNDLCFLFTEWLSQDAASPADISGDSRVNLADFSVIAQHWLDHCPAHWPMK